MRINLPFLRLLFIIALPCFVQSQSLKTGQYPTRIFGPDDYEADQSILGVLEDNDGRLLIANTDGVLVFNGSNWELIRLDRNSRALWLTKDASGRVFVAGEDELGYLELTNNQYSYTSLTPLLPDTLRGFGSLWEVESASYGTYFRSSRYLFRYHQGAMHVLSFQQFPGGTFDVLQSVNDTIYVRKRESGIGQVVGNSFKLIPNGAAFKSIKIQAILPLGSNLLVLTRNEGIRHITKSDVQAFAAELSDDLSSAKIYHGATKNGLIAVATLTHGVYLLDASGKMVAHINEADYGINESANCTYFDEHGALWIGTLNGVARVEIQDGIRVHPSVNKKDHAVYDFERFNGQLYVGTHAGLFKITNHDFENAEGIKEFNSRVLNVKILDGMLSATGYAGTCFIDSAGNEVRLPGIMQIHKIKGQSAYLGAGQEGLELLRKTGNVSFEKIGKLPVPNNITHVYEFEPNKIWAASSSAGLTYYDLDSDSIKIYDDLVNTRIEIIDGVPHFISTKGVFEYANERLQKSNFIYTHIDSAQFVIQHLEADTNGNLVILYSNSQGSTLGLWLRKLATGYSRTFIPDLGLSKTDFITTFLEDNGMLWIASNKSIFQVNLNQQFQSSHSFEVLITAIRANDSTLRLSEKRTAILFDNNKLSFEFGSLHLSSLGGNSYQYRLIGLQEEWSKWSDEKAVSYPYLPPGDYTFEVRGINAHQVYSAVTSFSFTILEPWYANRWAYLSYGILLTVFVIAIVRIRSANLKRDKERLQQIIAERTEEIAAKNQKLEEMDKIKNRFYSNISHEFRTPLTLIIGPLEDYMETDEMPTKQAYQGLIKNARRLLDLINQLLDLTKLEARQMPLELTHQRLGEYTKTIYASFEGLAKHDEVEFHLQLGHGADEVSFDIDKMDKILYNLLSNAFKFTPRGGQVKLVTSDDTAGYQLSVVDTGAGISAAHLPFIFDRFYQTHETLHATQPGTGIGLSLVKELVMLHGGVMDVVSTPNEGSTFTVRLPRHPASPKLAETPGKYA